MELAQPLPSDGQLVDAARRGSEPAWSELVSRHGWVVVAVAKRLRLGSPKRTAHDAMERVRDAIETEAAPPDDVEAVRAVRPRLVAELNDGRYGPGDGDGVDEAAEDGQLLASAFARLPESWQAVLWHGVVERMPAGEMTPLLGRGVNDVIALQHTARSGLHQSYLRALADGDDAHLAEECRPVVPLLSAAGRRALAAHDQRLVDSHVASGRDGEPCDECRDRLDQAATIDDRLPAAIVPGIAGMSVDRYRRAIGVADPPVGAAALVASRSARFRKLAVVGAAAVIAVAVVGALLLIRRPFDEVSVSSADGVTTTGEVATTVDGGDPPDSTTAGTPAPATTALELRPPPSGPANTVELVFASEARALGVAAPEPDVDVVLRSPGRVFAGGTGTVDVTITSRAATASDFHFEIRTPAGVLFGALVDGEAECVAAQPDAAAFCNVNLEAGGTRTLAIRLDLETSVVGRLIVDPGVPGEPLEVGIAATPRLVHSSVGRGDIVMIGNTVISCASSTPQCAGARDLTGAVVNRWDVPMEFIGVAPGWRNSSSATLELPPGATVAAAYLVWSGDLDERGVQIADDGGREQVTMRAAGAVDSFVVQADGLLLGDVDATQYFGFADVTDAVGAAGAGVYTVGNVDSVEVQGSYAGWSLVVVTSDDALPRRQHIVTSPFAWFAPEYEHRALLPVPFGTGRAATIDLLAFEGEPGFLPERIAVGETVLGGTNEFDGSIIGERDPAYVNNFGMDIESYALTIDAPDGSLIFDATSDKDGVRLAAVGLTVDLEP